MRKTGLSALLNQDLKLVNVLKTVCSLASSCRVSLHTQDSLPLAFPPGGNSVLNLHRRADRNSVCSSSDGFYVVECQAM